MERIKMIITYQGKKYIGYASEATSDAPAKSYSAWIYAEPTGGKRIGTVTWPTVDGWEDHTYDQETGKCCVEGCTGWCEDESNACTWLDEDAAFEPYEYFDVDEKELLRRMEEVA